jgi:hypothetical protein
MARINRPAACFASLALIVAALGCGREPAESPEGTMEQAGEEADEAAEDASEGAEDAADEAGDAVERATD